MVGRQTSFGDILGIAGILLGITVWLTQPGWLAGSLLAVVAIGLVAFAAVRHAGSPVLRTIIASLVIIIFVAVVWRPIWDDFHKKYPHVTIRSPIVLDDASNRSIANEPPDMPPLNLPGPALSKFGNVMFICTRPKDRGEQTTVEERKAEIRRITEIMGNALGLDYVLSDIPHGVRFDVTARNSQGQLSMEGMQRLTIQVEASTSGIFLTFNADLPGVLAILGGIPIDRNSDNAKEWMKLTEQLGFASGTCRLL